MRLAAIFWIQSLVRKNDDRQILLDLDIAIQRGEADFCAFRTISERRIDAGLPQIGRFEHVRVRRENQGQHRHLLSDLIAGSTFGNRPIAVKVGLASTWAASSSRERPESAQPRHSDASRRRTASHPTSPFTAVLVNGGFLRGNGRW
jgi:hypothetical protein